MTCGNDNNDILRCQTATTATMQNRSTLVAVGGRTSLWWFRMIGENWGNDLEKIQV